MTVYQLIKQSESYITIKVNSYLKIHQLNTSLQSKAEWANEKTKRQHT